jgi:hypothetical protein
MSEDTCKWREYGESKKQLVAKTECGRYMNINYETLEESKKSWLTFCPFCGKKVK